MNIRLKNDLIRSIHNFDEKRSKWPTLGRKRKLNTAQILDRILYVCKTGCQWSHLPVEGASFEKLYPCLAIWSKARLFERVLYNSANVAASGNRVKNVHGSDVVGPNQGNIHSTGLDSFLAAAY